MPTMLTGTTALLDSVLDSEDWGRRVRIARHAFDPATVSLSSARVESMLEVSLLRWPYFSVLRAGEVPATERYTTSRNVIGHPRDGFVDGPAVRKLMTAGGTLKLNRIADWNRESREVKAGLEQAVSAAVSVFGFYTPQRQQGMLPHRDASHVIVAQVEGSKSWRVYGDPADVRGDAGTDVSPDAVPTDEFTLHAGDLMYLPHGWPHCATAGDEGSWHVTFTLTQPTAEDLLEAFTELTFAEHTWLTERFHALDVTQRAAGVRSEMVATLATLSPDTLTEQALSTLRSAHA